MYPLCRFLNTPLGKTGSNDQTTKGAITSKIKHAIKHAIELKTSLTCTTVAALITILF